MLEFGVIRKENDIKFFYMMKDLVENRFEIVNCIRSTKLHFGYVMKK